LYPNSYTCDMTLSYVCVTWHIHMCDRTHSYVWQDTFICVTGHIHMCDMTHSYVWQDTFICVTGLIICVPWHIHMRDKTLSCVTWIKYVCDMICSWVWGRVRYSFIRVPQPIRICYVTHLYVRPDSFIRATQRIHMYDVTHPWHDSFTCVTHHICMRNVTPLIS
jgi:hypothetical protein